MYFNCKMAVFLSCCNTSLQSYNPKKRVWGGGMSSETTQLAKYLSKHGELSLNPQKLQTQKHVSVILSTPMARCEGELKM